LVFFPHSWRVASFSVNTRPLIRELTRQTIPRQSLADDLAHGHIEAVPIGQFVSVIVFAVVVAVGLLVKVPEQVGGSTDT
jgi:hypothetical protein